MRRFALLLAGLLLACGVVGWGSFRLGSRLSTGGLVRPTDDLEWLRLEFNLGQPEMARIRRLHEGYLPVCHGYCERIAAAKAELRQALSAAPSVPPVVDQKLLEIGTLRAQCQAAMLRHFVEVSQLMPEPQGTRYLVEMERLTLGVHEQIENSMTPPTAPHEHHGH